LKGGRPWVLLFI